MDASDCRRHARGYAAGGHSVVVVALGSALALDVAMPLVQPEEGGRLVGRLHRHRRATASDIMSSCGLEP